eukprot:TRINITY_DN18346_c0_g1_i1.p1 TRINITY_DN18346_c0_g1~~TRINITY_DN18346_c0_g1_i1.p1  ORF type:complete len:313 (+),score=52.63 TRINITY_DN18346_c0_g1_i1:35-973(+)
MTGKEPGLLKRVLAYRLDIDVEFQGWILMFATITAIWVLCLPCYCGGLSNSGARRFASWLRLRLPLFYTVALLLNAAFLFLIVTWLPDWEPADYVNALLHALGWVAGHLLGWMDSIIMILAFAFVIAFKDRIALLLGLDHLRLFRCKARDIFGCCGPSRFRPISLTLWKVEDLTAGDLFSANNVFVEVHLGYNEAMRTRVHNNAGSASVMKEAIHLNFDEGDEDENLFIFVKNQKMMGASDLARLEITPAQLNDIEAECRRKLPNEGALKWEDAHFVSKRLNPRGMIYFRVSTVDEESGFTTGGLVHDFTTC